MGALQMQANAAKQIWKRNAGERAALIGLSGKGGSEDIFR